MAVCQATWMLAVLASSRASPLPQGYWAFPDLRQAVILCGSELARDGGLSGDMDVGCTGVVSGSSGEGAYCHEQRRNRPGLVEFAAGYQFGDMGQGHSQAFQGFGFVAFELAGAQLFGQYDPCLLYTSPSPRDGLLSRMPSSA